MTTTCYFVQVSSIEDVTKTTELKPGDKFEWTAVLDEVDYFIKIYGEGVRNSSLLGDGQKTSLEIPYSSLRLENSDDEGDPLVINIEVLAIGKSSIKGKGGPFVKSMSSM